MHIDTPAQPSAHASRPFYRHLYFQVLCAIVLPYVALEASRCQTAKAAEPAWATLLLCVPLLGPALWNAVARRPVAD